MFRPICLETVATPGFAVAGLARVLELLGHARSLATPTTVWQPLLVMIVFSLATISHAAVFERDWEKAPPGNGLLTFDDINNREWLDLTETLLEKFSDNPGGDKFETEDEYQNVIAELVPGGRFEGFSVAMSADAAALAESAAIELGTLDFATNETASLALIELLGDTVDSRGDGKFSAGFLDEVLDSEIPGCAPCRSGATYRVNPTSGPNGDAGFFISSSSDLLATTRAGVMLYRVIPEPQSATLVIIALLLVLLIPIRKNLYRFTGRISSDRLYQICEKVLRMFRTSLFYEPSRDHRNLYRKLNFERCEDRCMLDAQADIVFLVDESFSSSEFDTQEWLTALVTGDNNADNTKDFNSLSEELNSAGITDVRYGLVGFGENTTSGINRYAHSQLFLSGDDESLIADPSVLTITQLNDAFGALSKRGGQEDGWDAIEHAIAEYDFRPGAVPVLVLVQTQEGRNPDNDTLVRDGIYSALVTSERKADGSGQQRPALYSPPSASLPPQSSLLSAPIV